MAHKNDSSEMKACLSQTDEAHENRAGPSREATEGSSPKRKHSESSSTEATGSRENPDTGARSGDACGGKELKREPKCHMQLDNLSASVNHTVLINTNEFRAGRLVAYTGSHVWDRHHVKLPPQYPKKGPESRWAATEKALTTLIKSPPKVKDVEWAIKSYNQANKKEWNFHALYASVKEVPDFSHVISKMAKLALKLPELIKHPIPLLWQHQNHTITMSQEQISCLLANAFFCTFPHRNTNNPGSEFVNFPTINFSRLFDDACPRKTQKLRALFHYFNAVTKGPKPDGLVTFERICMKSSDFPEWMTQMHQLTNLKVYSTGCIEKEGKGMLQVDFASKFIGGGVLGNGLVQEEIRFLQSPELIVARLFTEKLADNECLKITGVQTYSKTCGYSDSFKWVGPHTDDTERDEWKRRYCQIVAIDALHFNDPRAQFTEQNIKRELIKAYVGFKRDPNIPPEYTPAIATGNWGCGAFHGDPMLKALIQMMAAAVAERDLAYFTFGDKSQADELQRIHKLLTAHKRTVGELYHLLKEYCMYYSHHHHKPKNVFEYIREKMVIHASQL